MAIVIDIVNTEEPVSLVVGTGSPVEIVNTTNDVIDLNVNNENSVAIDVMRGLPGVQNLYVGYTPPNSPQEGWVWIDLNG